MDLTPVVAVPARNEERRLPLLLDALAGQTWLSRADRRLDVVIVLDACTDGSHRAAQTAADRHPLVRLHLVQGESRPHDSNVGATRRRAMDHALGLRADLKSTVVMTTDADGVPAPRWIDANLAAIAGGIDLVGGEICGDREEERLLGPRFLRRAALIARYEEAADRLESLLDPLVHDPWPRHRNHTGASLAVRGEVYRAVGGVPALACREDLAFVSRVRAAGYLLQQPRTVRVEVSARLDGRAAGGMADCLRGWVLAEEHGEPVLVESPDRVAQRAQRRALLRGLSDPASHAGAAAILGLERASFHDPAGRPLSTPALVEALAPDEPDAIKTVPVEIALQQIAAMIEALGDASIAA